VCRVDDRLDLDAVRLLSVWMSARTDLTNHLDLLTAFGPYAAEQVARNLWLVDGLQEKSHDAWLAYRDYVLSQTGEDATRPLDP